MNETRKVSLHHRVNRAVAQVFGKDFWAYREEDEDPDFLATQLYCGFELVGEVHVGPDGRADSYAIRVYPATRHEPADPVDIQAGQDMQIEAAVGAMLRPVMALPGMCEF